MKKKTLLFVFVLMISWQTNVFAQERQVTGTVSSTETNDVLLGVTVQLKNTSVGTVTDLDGSYSITVPGNENNILVFTYMGFESREIEVGDRNVVNVSLSEFVESLDEVLVVGYGTQKRKEVSGAISSVKGEEIAKITTPGFDRAIQGKAAGVQINSSNGIPGGATEVRIRGTGSINAGNQPLYIIDGVQVTSDSRTANLASSNPLSGLNSEDIASIEILKDAAAASIYGAQAGNGVIIITTKKGSTGKPVISLDVYTGITSMAQDIDLLNGPQWVVLNREAQVNTGNVLAGYYADALYGSPESAPTYDWLDAITRSGKIYNAQLSVSGGTEKTKYYLSGSYNSQEHQFKGYDFARGTFRVNMDNELSDKISLQTRINLSSVKQHSMDVPSFQTYNIFISGLAGVPVEPIYNEDGSINTNLRSGWDNPLFSIANNKNTGITNQVVGNFALNYDIIPGLRFKSSYSLEYTTVKEELFYDPRSTAGIALNGVVRFNEAEVTNWQTDQTLTFNKLINDKHSINALLGFNYRNETFTNLNTQGNGVAIPEFGETLTGTTPAVLSSAYNQFITVGVFGRVGYTFDDKYIIQATLRRDGSSRFGSNNKFGWFPAISGAWRIAQESFMEDTGFISELKLRASYGETGNSEISFYPGLSLFASNADASYNSNAGILFNQLGNSDLGWERNVTTNFGLDYSLFRDRISGSLDYFVRTTKDLLLNRPLPNTSGFSSIAENIGSLENRGWEIGLNTVNLDGDFKWTTNFNITFIKNEIRSLLNPGEDLPASNLWIGRPMGSRFMPKWAGVNPADGRAMWYTKDGDITYTPTQEDRVFLKDNLTTPDYYGGITNTFGYKGLELSMFFQYQVGTMQQDQPRAWLLSDFKYNGNQYVEALNRWTTPGQITDTPRLYPGSQAPGTSSSVFGSGGGTDRFYSDASYLRLKSLSLGYTLPESLTSRLRLDHLRVYIQGYNLLTWTNYTGLDPEFAAGSYNMGSVPQSRSYTLGIQASL
ncbi:SusC/RagA family TonB-linked outer membrane protein [Sinomicrobium soli]|uniref:SusC/RagA family TonB-linked outer membrane protein n=1 Tax=Sinomicrobium sp. N-1-3-6 TaxID=2219864 RepID=UPI000DCC8286|nr:TonB-dependent receptor [Sinomicrobium sp. N-1-3-6]RAV28075.1 SusC/RagA family TonB-linked outer membrane protein [Sinomicrobium sp. N-1-3-6]